ncbi:helix-turn-helix transcriptional regulator [Dyella choica]|uniref:YafY family transcriptional regulator n=1 Tax=Dyella choica TaxID=1927959 RepID=A0A3S0PNP6_9GAMM|nr:YafY family protein [Dyella choica]RUL75934.1 YafY family transcriptional regulator [Dyella choica]
MYHPTSRALAVLELLQAHRRISGSELARRLAIHPRTLRRYITILEEIGIPITAERGRHGAYMLVPGFKLPPMMFSDDEALALSVGLLAAQRLGMTHAGAVAASAQAKLERVMPERLQQQVRALTETVSLESGRPAPNVNGALLMQLSKAAQERQQIRLSYRSPQDEHTERAVDPFGLGYRNSYWYLVGRCHLRQDLRSFRLDRITAAQPLGTGFERPAHFDTLAHLADSLATQPRTYLAEVELFTDLPHAMNNLGNAIGVFEPIERGVLMRSQVDDLDWLARELARLPFGFRVNSPALLRHALQNLANRLAMA